MNQVVTKYAVKLSIIANSFYDPFSKANLFRDTPYYLFNHEPTNAIINGVKSGRLLDIKGNIPTGRLIEVGTISTEEAVDIDAIRESVRKEIESEVKAELAAAQADAEEKANKAKTKGKPSKEDSEK